MNYLFFNILFNIIYIIRIYIKTLALIFAFCQFAFHLKLFCICENQYRPLINIESENNIQNTLSTGSLIDEVSCLLGEKSKGTFRAMSHVQVLEIPRNLYYTFVKNNNLHDHVTHWYSNQQFLRSTWLFGEMTAYPMQKKNSSAYAVGTLSQGTNN